MDTIVDTSAFLGKFLYYFLESVIYKVIPKKKKDVAGEIVLITGAGSGIGRLMALHFASLGAILVLWDINEEGNMETCRLAKEKGGVKVFVYTCDCGNRQEVYRVADQVKREVGDVNILINNAGIVSGKYFLDIPDHMVEKSFLVNVMSHIWTYKSFLPAMLKANRGHLVCISSVAGKIGTSGLVDYCASKFAAYGLAEALFYELTLTKKTNIKTTIVCPFFIGTGMFAGCVTKYPLLLPVLDQNYVAQTIVNGILKDEVFIVIPKFVNFALILKEIISPKMNLALAKYLGMETFMANFIGRHPENKERSD
ncbi:PREDICTED: short-chain dehydrogenase/reductase family 16C member 6-like [Condylura cristata]|uniref:short-chain dehydrogenase/reductase family 16C member 6-like n=1 Tax=Condylura cristata TaxID=143302 RepID=UPI00033433C2|nr:PREDICTED: short-chain dehydrogenase/reductase family 16C member 6-like [Condylura cristata]